MPGPHWVSTVRDLAVREPRNPASAGHGLMIFLEKLGFCQVPLLQILPGAGGFPPTEVLSPALQLLWGLCRLREATTSDPTQGAQPVKGTPTTLAFPWPCTQQGPSVPRTFALAVCLPGHPFPHLQHQSFSFPAGFFSCLDGLPRREFTPSTHLKQAPHCCKGHPAISFRFSFISTHLADS